MADQLVAMGFDKSQAEAALGKTGGSIERAMDILLAGPVEASPPAAGRTLASSNDDVCPPVEVAPAPVAKSLKCEDCGKILRTEAEAQAHAARTKHTNFSESTEEKKALTAEEKAEQYRLLKEKMQQKKEAKMQEAMVEKKEREKVRRIEGQKKGNVREEYEHKRMLKEAAERKAEKLEAAKAKAKVKAQIEQDRLNRRAAQERAKNPTAATQAAAVQPSTAKEAAPKKTYNVCKIRLQLKPPVSGEFEPGQSVDEIFQWARTASSSLTDSSFSLNMTRPRKVFNAGDTTLISESGLMPSAALAVQFL